MNRIVLGGKDEFTSTVRYLLTIRQLRQDSTVRIAVTGAAGQLGSEVVKILSGTHDVRPFEKSELDIADYEMVMQALGGLRADAIINCAAFTDVDRCESEKERAFEVNCLAIRYLIEAARSCRALLCHISTDYVFDGGAASYTEWDSPSPISTYGASKLAGERELQTLCENWLLVRTSWLYGNTGKNFVKTILMLAREQDVIEVVDDQRGSPSYAQDVARVICELVIRRRLGIFHVTNSGDTTWFGFARAIFEEAGLDPERIEATDSRFVRRPACRPASSVLENVALRYAGIEQPRHWREALAEYISGLKEKQ